MQKLREDFPFLNKRFKNILTDYLWGDIHDRRIIISVESTDESWQWIIRENRKYIVVAADVNTKVPTEITEALTKIVNNEPVEQNEAAKILQNLLG